MPKRLQLMLGGALLAAVITGVGLAADGGNGRGEVIQACVKKNGQIRVLVDGGACASPEVALDWNIEGAQGPPGPSDAFSTFKAGPEAVPSFEDTIFVPLAKLPLDAGKYVIVAKAWFSHAVFQDERNEIDCTLSAGADSDHSRAAAYGAEDVALPFNLVHTFTEPGVVRLECRGTFRTPFGFPSPTQAHDIKITAMRVGSLSSVQSP